MGENWDSVCTSLKSAGFSGSISIFSEERNLTKAFGCRDRANGIDANTATAYGIASGTKVFTAVAIAKLIESGDLDLSTTAKSVVGGRLNTLHGDVTIGHLLQHRSGIGDYLDEEEVNNIEEFRLGIPVDSLLSPLDYLPLFEGKPHKFLPGSAFSYSNGGYVLLACIIELVSEAPYQDFVAENIFARAGMNHSAFHRSDSLPNNVAIGYVGPDNSLLTNIFHLPITGGGDGGAYVNTSDMAIFWGALNSGEIIETELVANFWTPRSEIAPPQLDYGSGFWINKKQGSIVLEGGDAGVSFRSKYLPTLATGYTVVSNTTEGAWSAAKMVDKIFLNYIS